jgi:PKD domain
LNNELGSRRAANTPHVLWFEPNLYPSASLPTSCPKCLILSHRQCCSSLKRGMMELKTGKIPPILAIIILASILSPALVCTSNGTSSPVPKTAHTITFSSSAVADFLILADPTKVSAQTGVAATSTVTVQGTGNFTGKVSLTASTDSKNVVCTLSSALIPTGFGSSTLSCIGYAPGNYTAIVDASSASLAHSVTITVVVLDPPNSATVSISPENVTDISRGIRTVTFAVTVSSAPPLDGFSIVLQYDRSALNTSLQEINLTDSVLGPSSHTLLLDECVNLSGLGCGTLDARALNDNDGEVGIVLVHNGNFSSPSPTNGLLFSATFTVIGVGFSQVHIFSADLATGAGSSATNVPVKLVDGYYTNISCPSGTATPCEPPLVNITMTYPESSDRNLVSFNATVVDRNAGAHVISYQWNWGDDTLEQNQTNLDMPITHTYANSGNFTVNMVVFDNESVVWATATVVSIPLPAPYFTVQISPGYLLITSGSSTAATIGLNSVDSFTGNVTLTATISPTNLTSTPQLSLIPSSVLLQANLFSTAGLYVSTLRTTTPQFYTLTVFATSGNLTIASVANLQVLPLDIPPVASFSFSPANPMVGQEITFDGSNSSALDGRVVEWIWNFSSAAYWVLQFSNNASINHVFSSPGNYNVMLTVMDNIGLRGSKSLTVSVQDPLHDVGIVQASTFPPEVVSTENVRISVYLANTGRDNETVSLTAYANNSVVETLNGIFLETCPVTPSNQCPSNSVEIIWNTTGVKPGNYTISSSVFLPTGESDPTPQDNSVILGSITVLPAPIIILSPTSGPVGANVRTQASGFHPQLESGQSLAEPVLVSFDGNFLGEAFAYNGTFLFTFDVIVSQPGPHLVIAQDLTTGARAVAVFTVTSQPTGTLTVTINTGTVYFPGDSVTVYILTSLNGVPVGPSGVELQLLLHTPGGSNLTLTADSIGPGLYEATYSVPRTGPLGTYFLVTYAHQQGPLDASAIASFEVKPIWLSSNGRNIMSATAALGLVGLVAVSWKKGYLSRKRKDEILGSF